MKKALLLFLTCLTAICAYAQSEEMTITEIEKQKSDIFNNLNNYRKTEDETDSLGYWRVYRQGNDLRAIMMEVRDNYDSAAPIDKKVEWLFSNNHLLYAEQTWTNVKTGEVIDNQKFYIGKDDLVTWLKFDSKLIRSTLGDQEVGKELIAYSELLKNKVK
jgi:hypothetical protein